VNGTDVAAETLLKAPFRLPRSFMCGSRFYVQSFSMNTDPASAKHQMIRIIEQQPENSSYDDILRELAFARMIARGLADSDAGRTISHKEMKRVIESWRK